MATDGVTCITWLVASFLFPPFFPLASRLNPCLWGPLPRLTIGQFSSYPYRCLANPSALSPHFFQALKIFRPIASNFSIAARLSDALTPQCRCPARRRRRTCVAALPRAQCVAQPSARAPRLDRERRHAATTARHRPSQFPICFTAPRTAASTPGRVWIY
ncbi:hypothetical protein B0H10DRAFT_2082015 [Mycena sp. CBHHK59/15]|nr:hypothetical protein B0H10DRAFT_2082015 [Mycena sp. CBHHK59/15]